MECRAYGICLDSQSRGYLGKDRKVSSAAGGNLSRMHKTEETAKERRLNFMYSHLRNRTLETLLEKIFGMVRIGVSAVDRSSRFYVLWRYAYRVAELEAGEAIVFTMGQHVELDGP